MKPYAPIRFPHLDEERTLFKRKADQDKPGKPWIYRATWGDKAWHVCKDKVTKEVLGDDDAIAFAKEIISAQFKGPKQYEQLRDATKLRGAVTVTSIIEKWIAAGYAQDNGTKLPASQAKRHAVTAKKPLVWFADKPVSQVNQPMLVKYAQWRRANIRKGSDGGRMIDRELNTLTQCFYWATAIGLADKNPFIDRPQFHASDQIEHATKFMPASDDELHRICGWLIATGNPGNILAGAQLMFMALTGLRSGEPGFLRWNARYTDAGPECGHRFERTLEGKTTELLAIARLKSGINPAVRVTPALASFLEAWRPYCRQRWPKSPFWFPHTDDVSRPFVISEDPNQPLNWRLARATKALGLPKRKAHGMRAFYVRVRRSEGASDSIIADELGQGSGPALIVSTYGEADQIRGDGRLDWMPSPDKGVQVAWTLLAPVAENIVAMG